MEFLPIYSFLFLEGPLAPGFIVSSEGLISAAATHNPASPTEEVEDESPYSQVFPRWISMAWATKLATVDGEIPGIIPTVLRAEMATGPRVIHTVLARA